LQLESPADLIAWAGGADKAAIAALTIELFAAAAARDKIARAIVAESAELIAGNAIACARRLVRNASGVEFVLTGSVLQKQPAFASEVGRHLKADLPGAEVKVLAREGAWGAVFLARQQHDKPPRPAANDAPVLTAAQPALGTPAASDLIPRSRGLAPTEQRNPLSRKLDRMSVAAAIRLMLAEDATIPAALLREHRKICQAVQLIVRAYQGGGRLIYVGAGTSGRLGALDAYECPPTFSVPPEMTQAIVAGGEQAMHGAQEDAEDDLDGGARALRDRGVSNKDVVIGIAASGRTPFVWGALHAARDLGATTILVCFNPSLVFDRGNRPDLVIAPAIGPEVQAAQEAQHEQARAHHGGVGVVQGHRQRGARTPRTRHRIVDLDGRHHAARAVEATEHVELAVARDHRRLLARSAGQARARRPRHRRRARVGRSRVGRRISVGG
jgi:hypothetical protein